MAEKKTFVEPQILADTDMETAARDFPLMPMVAGSGFASDAADASGDGDVKIDTD